MQRKCGPEQITMDVKLTIDIKLSILKDFCTLNMHVN